MMRSMVYLSSMQKTWMVSLSWIMVSFMPAVHFDAQVACSKYCLDDT